jgi:hypothetical protein
MALIFARPSLEGVLIEVKKLRVYTASKDIFSVSFFLSAQVFDAIYLFYTNKDDDSVF